MKRLLATIALTSALLPLPVAVQAAEARYTYNEYIGDFWVGTATLRSDSSRLYFSLPVGVPSCNSVSGLNAWVNVSWQGYDGSWYRQTKAFGVQDEGTNRTISGSINGYFSNLNGDINVETYSECIPLYW